MSWRRKRRNKHQVFAEFGSGCRVWVDLRTGTIDMTTDETQLTTADKNAATQWVHEQLEAIGRGTGNVMDVRDRLWR